MPGRVPGWPRPAIPGQPSGREGLPTGPRVRDLVDLTDLSGFGWFEGGVHVF